MLAVIFSPVEGYLLLMMESAPASCQGLNSRVVDAGAWLCLELERLTTAGSHLLMVKMDFTA